MNRRTLIIIVLAGFLMFLVMVVALVLTFGGFVNREKHAVADELSVAANVAESINITDMTGDGERNIFVQDQNRIRILDQSGAVLLNRTFDNRVTATQGDVDGDGIPDILAFTSAGTAVATLFNGRDETIWERSFPALAGPGRAVSADLDGDGRREFVIGDDAGHLMAISENGEELWQYDFPFPDVLRGLDEVRRPGGDLIAAGLESGLVVVLDGSGNELWTYEAANGLRRLRAFPIDDPAFGRVLIGSVNGQLTVHDGATSDQLWRTGLGQAVNEMRPVEADGDPATTEIAVGGKDGGVWALSQNGQVLWRAIMADKVNEVASINDPEIGSLVIAGDDTGRVNLYDSDGNVWHSFDVSGSVNRLDVGQVDGVNGFFVAGSREMVFYRPEIATPPLLYTPLLGGLLACGVIAAAAFLLSMIKPAPTLQVSAQELTVEAQHARRRMLHESINDLKKMEGSGEVPADSYLARMKELRKQLAKVNEALLKLGEPIKPETFTCPHCSGTLELGTDRCEYCGQVVIV